MNRIYTLLILILGSAGAAATDGYFMIGYGAKSIGIGGAGVGYAQDALVGAINPAGLSAINDGWDGGLRVLAAERNASIDCRGIGACDTVVKDRSARDLFQIPNFGWKRSLSDSLALGITLYGNGGINTTYGRALYDETAARIQGGVPGDPGFPRTGKLGLDFSQLFAATSLAWRVHPQHTLGISPIFAIQRFSARGFESFRRLSADSGSVTGRGTDYSIGGGVRVGWTGNVHPRVQLGAQYTSRIWTQRAKKYSGLLADGGRLDAPPHWTVGFAFAATERIDLVFDFQRILFDSVDSISNPGPTMTELAGVITANRQLGAGDGIGFGWSDQSVFKLGVNYAHNDLLTLRAGWNRASSQLPNREILINIPAPATINDNLTVGASWIFPKYGELSFAYMAALKKTNHDRSSEFFGTSVRASIVEHALDLSWGKHF